MAHDPIDPRALPWIRIGAYAVCRDAAKRVLLCRIREGYPEAGRWTLPGGGVDFGEHPGDGVLRELTEETGLSGQIESLLAIASGTVERPRSRPGPLHWVAIMYRVTIAGGELRDEPDGSSDQARWLAPHELAGLPLVGLVTQALAADDADPRVP